MKYHAFSVLVLALLCLGCNRTVVYAPEGPSPAVQVRNPMAQNARIRMNSVVIVDKNLQYWADKKVSYQPEWLSIFSQGNSENEKYSKIAVEGTNARRTPSGTVEVWANFRNRTDHQLILECRSHFFDQDEAPIESPSAWQRIYLGQQSVNSYKEFSVNVERVHYYYIEVREAM